MEENWLEWRGQRWPKALPLQSGREVEVHVCVNRTATITTVKRGGGSVIPFGAVLSELKSSVELSGSTKTLNSG